MATADTATEASVRASYTAFVTLMNDWARQGAPLALRAVGGGAAAVAPAGRLAAATT